MLGSVMKEQMGLVAKSTEVQIRVIQHAKGYNEGWRKNQKGPEVRVYTVPGREKHHRQVTCELGLEND